MGIFEFKPDAYISNIFFFKGNQVEKEIDEFMDEDDIINKSKNIMKKNYIYISTDGNITVKSLGVRKKSTSALTRKIFWDIMVEKIKTERKVKYPKKWFEAQIAELLNKDLELAAKRFTCNAVNSYKMDGQLQRVIAQRYGPGIHFLICNYKYGIGKGKKWCTIEEFKNHNMTINDIDLSGVWNELSYFIEDYNTKTKNVEKTNSLMKWF